MNDPSPALGSQLFAQHHLVPWGACGPERRGAAFWHDKAQTSTASVLPASQRAGLFMPATPSFPRLRKNNEAVRGQGACTGWHPGWERDEAEPAPCLCLLSTYCFRHSFLIQEWSLLSELQSSPDPLPTTTTKLCARLCIKNKESGFPWWPVAKNLPCNAVNWDLLATEQLSPCATTEPTGRN